METFEIIAGIVLTIAVVNVLYELAEFIRARREIEGARLKSKSY